VKFLLFSLLFIPYFISFSQKEKYTVLDKNAINADLKWSVYVKEHRDSLYILGKSLIEIGQRNKHEFTEIVGKNYVASYLIRTGKISAGRKIFKPLLRYFILKNDLARECRIITEIGNSFFLEGSIDESIQYFEKSLKKSSESSDVQLREMSRISYAKALLKQKKYVQAEAQLILHCKNLRPTKYFNSISNAYAVLSTLYIELNKDSLSDFSLKESLRFAFLSGSQSALANAFNNLGIQAVQKEQIKTAFCMFRKAEDCYHETRNINGIIQVYYNFGLLYHIEKDFKKAIEYFRLSRQFALEIDNLTLEIDALYELNLIAKDMKNDQLAFSTMDTIIELKDQQINKIKNQFIEQNEFSESLLEMDETNDTRTNELMLRNQSSEKYVIWLLFVIISLIFAVLYFYWRLKKVIRK
jgi:tetratricopeptide (TPR) repeat protein